MSDHTEQLMAMLRVTQIPWVQNNCMITGSLTTMISGRTPAREIGDLDLIVTSERSLLESKSALTGALSDFYTISVDQIGSNYTTHNRDMSIYHLRTTLGGRNALSVNIFWVDPDKVYGSACLFGIKGTHPLYSLAWKLIIVQTTTSSITRNKHRKDLYFYSQTCYPVGNGLVELADILCSAHGIWPDADDLESTYENIKQVEGAMEQTTKEEANAGIKQTD